MVDVQANYLSLLVGNNLWNGDWLCHVDSFAKLLWMVKTYMQANSVYTYKIYVIQLVEWNNE